MRRARRASRYACMGGGETRAAASRRGTEREREGERDGSMGIRTTALLALRARTHCELFPREEDPSPVDGGGGLGWFVGVWL